MEQNLPILSKKLWNMAKLTFFMLRKGISKKKILLNLNSMMKKRDFPTHIQYALTNQNPREYEFSCRNTPLYRHYFTNRRSKNQHYLQNLEYDLSISSPNYEDIDMKRLDAIDKILETIVLSNKDGYVCRELRVTDSPFPVRNAEVCDQCVDEDAEEFIKRFYSELVKEQTC